MKTIQRATPEELEAQIVQGRNQLRTERMDISIGEIMNWYSRGELEIRPAFQRAFRWDISQRTRFIESLLLGIPIPPIFVAENDNKVLEVVDGLQRLSTVLSFFGELKSDDKDLLAENNWVLTKGDRIEGLENYNWMDLPQKYRISIKRYVCRLEMVYWNSNYDMRFELFNRLNTGGASLTPQEIRNAIYRDISPKFNDFTKKLSEYPNFKKITNLNKQQVNTFYDQELVLRFVSLYKNGKNLKSSISQHMSSFMGSALYNENFDYQSYENTFNQVIDILLPLGHDIFRQKDGKFATALYDTIMIGVAENIDLYQNIDEKKILKKINEVRKDEVLLKFSRKGGNNQFARVKNRLREAKRIFSQL